MYIIVFAKVGINGETHDEVMSDIGVKQRCPLPLMLFGLNVDELETYLEEMDKDSPCLFSVVGCHSSLF